mgnify:CR=1 FL=1
MIRRSSTGIKKKSWPSGNKTNNRNSQTSPEILNNNTRIYLSSPHLSGNEQKYIEQAFTDNWIAPLGPHVDHLESELAQYCGIKHAAVLSSGTAAIHLALILLDVKPDDLVICQSFTFSATANPILYQGATPVFIDSETETWNMDPMLLEKAIQDAIEGKINGRSSKPKAIIPVHLYGMPYKVDAIHTIAKKYQVPVIEDAAEALGSTYREMKCGSFGVFSILSFNGNKIITTSGGGALLSNDESLIKKARFLSTQARDPAPHYEHSQLGYNYRMSNILAGIGLGQMEVIHERVDRRRENFNRYKEHLRDIDGITFQEAPSDSYFSNRWLTTILIDPFKAGFNRETVRLALEKENIESRPLWKPMHLQPVFAKSPAYTNGNSENLFQYGLCLPSGSNMSDTDLERVYQVINGLSKK